MVRKWYQPHYDWDPVMNQLMPMLITDHELAIQKAAVEFVDALLECEDYEGHDHDAAEALGDNYSACQDALKEAVKVWKADIDAIVAAQADAARGESS
jgi:hypothetical protein